MADKRAFAVLDVGYFENPKMIEVMDASSNAVSMHVASILYCSQHLTDGFISTKAIQRKVGGSSDDAALLIDSGLWHAPGHDCESCPEVPEGKAYVHDYLEHNRSSEGSKRTSKKARDAALARWSKAKSEPKDDKSTDAPSNALSMPDAMHRQTDRQTKNTSPATQDEFDQWYSKYPKKEAKESAKKAFDKARKKASLDELITGLESYVRSIQGKDRQFIALPATWLNAGRWMDETASESGDLDPDAILGPDYWMVPMPPAGLSIQEELAWKKARRAEHEAERLEEARKKVASG